MLGDLVEFALRRLHALSSSTVKQAGFKALQLAMGVEPFSLERFQLTALEESASVGPRRTVTKVAPGLSEAAAVASVTSPKNADLVVTIEHELALLDESGDAEGVSGVGERMDMVSLCFLLLAVMLSCSKVFFERATMYQWSAAASFIQGEVVCLMLTCRANLLF